VRYDAAEGDEGVIPLGLGETWRDWAAAIVEMRRAVEVWDMTEARDAAGLSRLLRWREGSRRKEHVGTWMQLEGWVYDSHPDLPEGEPAPHLGRVAQFVPPVLDLFRPGDVLTPAAFLVQRWINHHLRGKATPRLVYDPKLGRRVIQIVPDNLLAAMWLQFAQAIAGNKEHRACKECGRWFEISSEEDGRTARRAFCSDPCKSRDYRRRKDRARQLKEEGKAVKDIASELGTDVQTIKKWVSKGR
jgi:hypothetical protein